MNDISKLIKNFEFAEAESKLEELLKKCSDENKKINYYYQLAKINTDYRNIDRNPKKAKRYIKICLNSLNPKESYYKIYAELEDDKIILYSVIQNGLKKLPKSEFLHQLLFSLKNDTEKKELYYQIKACPFFKENLIMLYLQYFFKIHDWNNLINLEQFAKRIKNKTNYIYYYFALGVAKIICHQNNEDLIMAKNNLELALMQDYDNILENNLHIFLAYCYMLLKEEDNFYNIINKLPIANKYMDLDLFPTNIKFNFESIYKIIFPEMIKFAQEKKYKTKISIIYALYLYYPSAFFTKVRFNQKNLHDILVNKHLFDDSEDYYQALCIMYLALNQKKEALQAFLEMNYHDFEKITINLEDILDKSDLSEIKLYAEDIKKTLEKSYFTEEVVKFVITPFILKCYELKAYEEIYELSRNIGISKITAFFKNFPLFEMAYASKFSDILFAKNLYELLLKDKKNSSTFNNLGVIYEELGYLSKASTYYNKALKYNEFNEIYINNTERIAKLLLKQNEGKVNLANENLENLKILLTLCNERNKYNIIDTDNIDLTKFDNLDKDDIQKYISRFLTNRYIFFNNDNNIIVDMDLLETLNNYQESLKKNKEYKKIADNINYEALNNIGFNENLLKKLNKIKDPDLTKILKRDLKECAISLVAKQYKSTIVLGGSIIEIILTFILKQNNITSYNFMKNGKKQKISLEYMGIENMLDIAKEKNLINSTIYHLNHYVREYRNAIHPSVEIRKNYEINENNAMMVWQILRETILYVFK